MKRTPLKEIERNFTELEENLSKTKILSIEEQEM